MTLFIIFLLHLIWLKKYVLPFVLTYGNVWFILMLSSLPLLLGAEQMISIVEKIIFVGKLALKSLSLTRLFVRQFVAVSIGLMMKRVDTDTKPFGLRIMSYSYSEHHIL